MTSRFDVRSKDGDHKAGTMTEHIVVASPDEGRLDRFLSFRFPDWSRTALQRLINDRRITVDGHPASPNHKLKAGQKVEVRWPEEVKRSPAKLGELPFPILYEDDDLFALDKPAGLVVHPSAGHHTGHTLVELVEAKLSPGPWPDAARPGLVHRLDRDTSGVIVMAKTPEAHRKLSLQFARRQTKKTYVALAKGRIQADEGVIESHLGRHPGKRQRFAVSGDQGRWSSTRFKVLQRSPGATLVELTPLTGRTHQIRVHLASYGHPILGDHVYGVADKEMPFITRHLLHARALQIRHPRTGADLRFEAPLPADFQQALKLLGFRA